MGYKQFHSIADLADERPFVVAAERAARRWVDLVRSRARELTPVAHPPEGVSATAFAGGRGRPPGTAKESWLTDAPTRVGSSVRAGVYSPDPVILYLEYGTRPHVIRPRLDRAPASVVESRRPRQTGERAALRFYVNGRPVYARLVHHPGTKPLLMMHQATAESVTALREFLRDELAAALDERGDVAA